MSVLRSHRKSVRPRPKTREPVRYAVVGLGHIAQNAVLPAFENASRNSELAALISDDPAKLKILGREYGVEYQYPYNEFEKCLEEADIEAVYIALPNHLHEQYTVRAARTGVHVLCEKPLAVTADQCRRMITECENHSVKLMAAYRLHFDPANLEAVAILQSGRLGQTRAFNSLFSFQVKPGNIRVKREKGGGTLFDIGIYCINAARYLFQAEPVEVFAVTANDRDKRFRGVEEMTSAILRFPGERLASFTCSFGAADESRYEVLGTKGRLRVSNAYEYALAREVEIVENGQCKVHSHKPGDQFAPELLYFSDCIQRDHEPEPSGQEGLVDVEIITALYDSARRGVPVKLRKLPHPRHPQPAQRVACPPSKKPKLLRVEAPTE
jgi:glucose-fructose oxidoreductase